jgi:hypothetical protein
MSQQGPNLSGYSIDTNVVIDGRVRRYPPDVFEGLWEDIADLIADGRAIIAEEVLYELGRGDDDCHDWAKSESGLVAPATAEVIACVAEIAKEFPDWVSGTVNEADPWVIAHAWCREWAVVTHEQWSGSPLTKNAKIPNVCAQFDVECIDFVELARRERWTFRR